MKTTTREKLKPVIRQRINCSHQSPTGQQQGGRVERERVQELGETRFFTITHVSITFILFRTNNGSPYSCLVENEWVSYTSWQQQWQPGSLYTFHPKGDKIHTHGSTHKQMGATHAKGLRMGPKIMCLHAIHLVCRCFSHLSVPIPILQI